MAHHIDAQTHECIDRCQSCQAICLETINHCLELGGRHAAAHHIKLLMACAEICDTSARLMLLSSEFHARACELCADLCDACATDCERIGEDETMQRCAEICRRCAESCRQMATTRA